MKLLKIPEVAEILRVRRGRAYELTAAGVLPIVRLGRRQVRVSEDALRAFIEAGGTALAKAPDESARPAADRHAGGRR